MLTPSASAPTLRVAIYRTSSFGDVVLATACLDLLERLPVPTEITWIGRGAALDMIANSWPTVKRREVARTDTVIDLQRAVDTLSNVHLFIDLQCNLRSRWLARQLKSAHGVPYFSADKAQLARSRLLVAARVRGRRRPLPDDLRGVPKHQFEMMCDALRKGLRHHLPVEMRDGIDAPARPRLPIPDSFESPWRKELHFGSWLGVAPGAAHPTKQAPFEAMLEVLERVKKQCAEAGPKMPAPLGLAFYGDNHDRQIALKLQDRIAWPGPVLNLAGRLSLWESAVALSETSCLLSNDSSLGHIAEAVDTPTAILFGPTVEAFGFAPRMRQSRAFSTPIGCRPCSKHGKVPCRYEDKLCFSGINLDDVATHLVQLLMAPESKAGRRSPVSSKSSEAAQPP
jgi:ADP-heptose:LPS heptosyltransferase